MKKKEIKSKHVNSAMTMSPLDVAEVLSQKEEIEKSNKLIKAGFVAREFEHGCIEVVCETHPMTFKEEANKIIKRGGRIMSSSCGTSPLAPQGAFTEYWMAIFTMPK